MNLLSKITIQGFRSIRYAEIELGPLNVLIGPNGAGKSNFIDFFRLLNYALSKGFQDPYQVDRGPASAILHHGPKVTGVIRGELEFRTEAGVNFYRLTLADTSGDRLTFTKEDVQFHRAGNPYPGDLVPLISHPSDNSGLAELWAENDPTAQSTRRFLQRCRVYQFHDTSLTAHMRDYTPTDMSRYLYADGGNLSAVLLGLRNDAKDDYQDIIRTLQAVLPWFDDFVLEPEGRKGVLLRWRMAGRGGDFLFGPGQLSDGSMRIMALVTLLLLPTHMLPEVIIIDEPELGLHPAAEAVVAGLIKNVSRSCQVLLSTQSAGFIDHFLADDIVVVENENGESTFLRQSQEGLKNWLERYTLSQIWSKNIIGGRP